MIYSASPQMIRTFLVEDEPPAMRKLERLASGESDLELCGSAATCEAAIEGIATANPQLVILDIRLPDGTGFEVLQALDAMGARNPCAIFLTAFDEYAVEAFQVAALDYLLKPVSQERFSTAIARVRERLAAQFAAQREESRTPVKFLKRFLVERRRAAYLLPVDDVDHIQADRNYARLHSRQGEFAIRATMDGLEKRLDPAEFARVSRGSIVRVAAIREVRQSDDQNFSLALHSGEEVGCSKKYWTAALDRLL
jgi:DNA-binding LytR/AlgR family response regulator